MLVTPSKWTAVAHDYHSPALRDYIWVKSFSRYPDLLKVTQPLMGILSHENEITYCSDLSVWNQCHQELKANCLADEHYLENLIATTNAVGEELTAWTEANVMKADLPAHTDEQLVALVDYFIKKQGELYAYGTAIPLLDFGGFSFVENNLNKILAKVEDPAVREDYYRTFTAPPRNSYAQDQEEALLGLMAEYYPNEAWRKDVATLIPDELQKAYPEFWHALHQHAERYGWVYYTYEGPAYAESDFLGFVNDHLEKGVIPHEKLIEIARQKEDQHIRKAECIEALKPSPFELMIINLAGAIVWAKPRRKDYQSKAYYHMERCMQEIANRLGVSLQQARSLSPEKISTYLANKEGVSQIADSSYAQHAYLGNPDGSVTTLSPSEVAELTELLKVDETEQHFGDHLKGNCARQGTVTGIVRLVNRSEDMHKMNRGDILVSVATSPSVVPAMKKAAAILTDEGGLTCHAAIVSRELGIPCVVGLKVVTKFLKDGDFVEVRAGEGIVKKISANLE